MRVVGRRCGVEGGKARRYKVSHGARAKLPRWGSGAGDQQERSVARSGGKAERRVKDAERGGGERYGGGGYGEHRSMGGRRWRWVERGRGGKRGSGEREGREVWSAGQGSNVVLV